MREMVTGRVAGLLYDGILSPSDWRDGLDTLREALGAGVFDYFTLDSARAHVSDSVDNQGEAGLYAEKLREYKDHYIGQDPRMAVLAEMPVGRVMLDHEHISTREMSHNVVYVDFLRIHGFQHTAAALVRDEGGSRDFLGFLRPADHSPYGTDEKSLIDRLMPDLRRAAVLRNRARHLAQQATLGLAAIDTLPRGIAVVDAQCRLRYSNPFAERLLAQSATLRVRHGRLECNDAVAHSQLRQLVTRAWDGEGRAAAGAQNLFREHERIAVTVLPLNARHSAAVHWQEPLALLVLSDMAAPAALESELVAQALGLSPAEARLAVLLASGKTVKDFAVVQGCTWNTARAHLAQLLQRAGCRRQADLVGLLQSLRLG